MKSSRWLFDIPNIPIITPRVLHDIGFCKEDTGTPVLEVTTSTLKRLQKFQDFDFRSYIIGRIKEYIATEIYRIISNNNITFSLTKIEQDLQGADVRMRGLEINGKKPSLVYVDITTSLRSYIEKSKEVKSIKNHPVYIMYIPADVVDHCFRILLNNDPTHSDPTPGIERILTWYPRINEVKKEIALNRLRGDIDSHLVLHNYR